MNDIGWIDEKDRRQKSEPDPDWTDDLEETSWNWNLTLYHWATGPPRFLQELSMLI